MWSNRLTFIMLISRKSYSAMFYQRNSTIHECQVNVAILYTITVHTIPTFAVFCIWYVREKYRHLLCKTIIMFLVHLNTWTTYQ